MKLNGKANHIPGRTLLYSLMAMGIALLAACTKQAGTTASGSKSSSIIQINVNATNYSFASAYDAISFSTLATISALPHYRQYVINSKSADGMLTFGLNFHIDSLGSGYYIMNSSQMVIGSKTYVSVAKNSTDKVVVTKLDNTAGLYQGTFNFYSYNKALPSDSILISGIYSIQ